MWSRWTQMQVTNGKAILEIADQVLEENLDIKISLSPVNEEGMPAISVAGDDRWDKSAEAGVRRIAYQAVQSLMVIEVS